MEKRILQRQLAESSIYYASERRRYRKLKTNIFLACMIAGVCVSIRLSEKTAISEVNDSTRQMNLNIPTQKLIHKFNRSQVA
jgi:hypothetical protein